MMLNIQYERPSSSTAISLLQLFSIPILMPIQQPQQQPISTSSQCQQIDILKLIIKIAIYQSLNAQLKVYIQFLYTTLALI